MPKIIGQTIDDFCNFNMFPGSGDLPRGETQHFYAAARRAQGEDPLQYQAGTAMIDKIHAGDHVLIVTGCRNVPALPYGETDGPIGAAVLARALDRAFGAKVIVTVEESNHKPVDAALRAAGCFVRDPEDLDQVDGACVIDHYPLGPVEGEKHARYLMDTYHPQAIIFIEKHGPNEFGEFHTALGYRIDKEMMANTQYLLPLAKEANVLTIGTGDGGNEIGNGVICHDPEALNCVPKDKCGCGGSLMTVAKTDIFVAASISNWGAYGMAAMIAYLLKDVDILHDEETEKRMVYACSECGSVDGLAMRPIPKVDGISLKASCAFVRLLRYVVSKGLMDVYREN